MKKITIDCSKGKMKALYISLKVLLFLLLIVSAAINLIFAQAYYKSGKTWPMLVEVFWFCLKYRILTR